MRHQIATFALAPLLYLQGRHTRRVTPVLPEPAGDRVGTAGAGEALQLLVTGDSAAAGVGAVHQQEALLGGLATLLSQHFNLSWELQATTGATTRSTLARLQRLEVRRYDLVVTSLGVNDVTGNLGLRNWLDAQRRLRELLRSKFETRLMIISGLPPMREFPALPQPLRWYLGTRADDFDRALRQDLDRETDAEFLSLRFGLDPNAIATDGFHPGPPVYAEWARRVSEIACARLK